MPSSIFESAESFDRAYDSCGLWGDWLRSRLAAVLELVGEGPGDILDAGMGPGRLVEELEQRGWTSWGIDASPQMVALARERVPDARERILEGHLERLPLADETFDAAVIVGVINHVRDPEAIVQELARVLRPGGRAVIGVDNTRSPFRIWRELAVLPAARALGRCHSGSLRPPLWHKIIGHRRAGRLLQAAGLEPEASRLVAYTLLPDPLDRVFPNAGLWLSRFAARRGSRLRSLAAMQLLIAARKPAPRQ